MRYKYYNKSNQSEIIAQVDNNDKVIGRLSRKEVHDSGILHREVGVWFLNKKGEILVQIRADNKHFDHTAGGHFPYSESYKQAAVREVEEEIGFSIKPKKLKRFGKRLIETKKEMRSHIRYLTLFTIRGDYKVNQFNPAEEVHRLKFYSPSNLLAMIRKSPESFTNGFATLLQEVYGKSQ